jgi:integrase
LWDYYISWRIFLPFFVMELLDGNDLNYVSDFSMQTIGRLVTNARRRIWSCFDATIRRADSLGHNYANRETQAAFALSGQELLRRSEIVRLRVDQLQKRESHWVIVDLIGKGGRLRTVPDPEWCKDVIGIGFAIRECRKIRCSGEFGETVRRLMLE